MPPLFHTCAAARLPMSAVPGPISGLTYTGLFQRVSTAPPFIHPLLTCPLLLPYCPWKGAAAEELPGAVGEEPELLVVGRVDEGARELGDLVVAVHVQPAREVGLGDRAGRL